MEDEIKSKAQYLLPAIEVLKEVKKPLTFREIYNLILQKGLDKKYNFAGKTPDSSVHSALGKHKDLFEISIHIHKNPKTKKESKINKYWLKTQMNELNQIDLETIESKNIVKASNTKEKNNNKSDYLEKDLDPILVKYLYKNENFGLYCKRIRHERSSRKKSKNESDQIRLTKWIHPDIVGVYFSFADKSYQKETLKLMENFHFKNKLYSFELKKTLDRGNLRESYFQAVSNSSWAHEGYLVALEITSDITDELKRLNLAFGIGVIKLDIDISKCQVLLPSRVQEELDIKTLNVLVGLNPDFEKFIENLNEEIEIGKSKRINDKEYDKVFEDIDYKNYIDEKFSSYQVKKD